MGEVTEREIRKKVDEVTALWLEELEAFRRASAAQRELDKMRLEYVGQGDEETGGQGEEGEDGGEDAG